MLRRPVRVLAALRSRLVMCFVAIAGVLAVAPAAHAYLSAPKPDVTVTFLGSGPAPLVCTSRPDTARVTIPPETWLKLVNHTGAKATLWLEDSPFPVADGEGQAFRLRTVGSYTVKLVPDCLVTVGNVAALTVVVAEDEPMAPPTAGGPGSTPGGSGPSSGKPPREARAGDSPPSTNGESGQSVSQRTAPTGAPSVGMPASGDGGGAGPTTPPSDGSIEDDDYDTYGFDTRQDGQGFRLLAIIAAVCVFGVSVAIIRVILAQRAT